MKLHSLTLALILLAATSFAAEDSPEDAKIRNSIPLGGDFRPNPKVGTFVVWGTERASCVSKDDGQTWRQAFFAAPGADHGPWATSSVAYTNGVFAVPVAWAADDLSRFRRCGELAAPHQRGNEAAKGKGIRV